MKVATLSTPSVALLAGIVLLLGSGLSLAQGWRGSVTPMAPGAQLAEFIEELALTPEQKAAAFEIHLYGDEVRERRRETLQLLAAEARAELAQPDADLRALAQTTELTVDGLIVEARTVRDRWLAFYEQELTAEQQAQVREAFLTWLERLERFSQWADQFRR